MSAISSSSVPGVARLEVDVGHAHDRLAREAVGAHAAAGALEPDLRRGLARGEEAGQHAVAHDRHGVALHALVVPAIAAEAARVGRVGGHVHLLGAEAERADRVGRDEAGAGVRGLAPEHAVELDGVPDRLVDLQRRAARRPGSAWCGPDGHGGARSSADRLGGHARRLAGEVERRKCS